MSGISGITLPFHCRDAVAKLCKLSKKVRASIQEEYCDVMDMPFIDLCQNDIFTLFQILRLCNVPILIAGRKTMPTRLRHILFIDIRHLPEITGETAKYWILDMETGQLVLDTKKMAKMPRLTCQHKTYQGMSATLSEILQVPKLKREPQSLDELTTLIDSLGMADKTNITYLIRVQPKQEYTWYTGKGHKSLVSPFSAHAYTKANLEIGYCFSRQQHPPQPLPIINDALPEIPDPSCLNRSTSVSVKVAGLRLAYALGLVTTEEMTKMSCAMSACVGALWITCDDEKHARYVTYKDAENVLSKTMTCCSTDDDVWLKLLSHMTKRAAVWQEKKLAILQPLLQQLEMHRGSTQSTLWTTCLGQLKQAIKNHKVFLFCSDDTLLHLVKVPLAGYCDQPKSRGVLLTTLSDNAIGALSGRNLHLINLANYFNHNLQKYAPEKDDHLMWQVCQDWLPADSGLDSNTPWVNPNLLHKRKTNRKYPPVLGTPMALFLQQRNARNAQAILDLYTQFVAFNVANFGFDVSTLTRVSLSRMAFDIVWLEYAKLAGPMAHPVEKMHPHMQHLLRPWCKGGFSFSCQDYLASDCPLEEGKENAASIREFDLTSAYGASASNMATAKGFGLVFKDDMVSQSRWNTFEYKATMYTLYKWTCIEKRAIRTVFSNFSPMGLAKIGKYPIDLVAIMEDGSIEMVQFDGHFVHGDYNNPECPSLSRYIGDCGRQACEEKTRQRDQDTINWMVQIEGDKITYTIITDCCHELYTKKALDHAFSTIPELAQLVAGIKNVRSPALDKVNLATTTFLAQVTGHATRPPFGAIGPVFNMDGTSFQDISTSSGKMLLTSDYYVYLQQFGFQVEACDWVVFYQRCDHLPRVFDKLVGMRTLAGPAKKTFIKSIVNMACGFFGLNSEKGHRTMTRISHRLPKNHSIFKHHIVPLQDFKGKPIQLITTLLGKATTYTTTPMPLVLFVGVIEYGKMLLNRALLCLQKHLNPAAFRLLYCNVDNMIIASSANCLEDSTMDIFSYTRFLEEFGTLTGDGPGLFKEEWCFEKPWQFVSPGRMQYCVNKDDASISKSCVIKGVSPKESFAIAMAMLNKVPITVNQTKAINKLAGPETHIVQYKL